MLTIRKKKPVAEATAAEEAIDASSAPVAEPVALEPEAQVPSGGASAKSYTVFAILGIVASLCVIVLLVMQFTELSFYKADPSVWPVK